MVNLNLDMKFNNFKQIFSIPPDFEVLPTSGEWIPPNLSYLAANSAFWDLGVHWFIARKQQENLIIKNLFFVNNPVLQTKFPNAISFFPGIHCIHENPVNTDIKKTNMIWTIKYTMSYILKRALTVPHFSSCM